MRSIPYESNTPILSSRIRLASYLELVNVQAAAHTACDGDHMCLVGVWIDEENIAQRLRDLVRTSCALAVASRKKSGSLLLKCGSAYEFQRLTFYRHHHVLLHGCCDIGVSKQDHAVVCIRWRSC